MSDANERESIEVPDLLPRLERITPAVTTGIRADPFSGATILQKKKSWQMHLVERNTALRGTNNRMLHV